MGVVVAFSPMLLQRTPLLSWQLQVKAANSLLNGTLSFSPLPLPALPSSPPPPHPCAAPTPSSPAVPTPSSPLSCPTPLLTPALPPPPPHPCAFPPPTTWAF